jgi:hypothetical protein
MHRTNAETRSGVLELGGDCDAGEVIVWLEEGAAKLELLSELPHELHRRSGEESPTWCVDTHQVVPL